MLTRDVQHGNLPNRFQIPAATLAAVLLAVMVAVAVDTKWDLLAGQAQSRAQAVQTSAVRTLESPGDLAGLERAGFATVDDRTAAQEAGLADLLIGDFVLPFEAVSLLLLAAVIGALALVRPR